MESDVDKAEDGECDLVDEDADVTGRRRGRLDSRARRRVAIRRIIARQEVHDVRRAALCRQDHAVALTTDVGVAFGRLVKMMEPMRACQMQMKQRMTIEPRMYLS